MRTLRIVVPIAILGAIFFRLDGSRALLVLASVDLPLTLAGFALALSLVALQGLRIQILSSIFPASPSGGSLQRLNFEAMGLDAFVPGKLGSDTYRLVSLSKSLGYPASFAIIVVMRVQTLLGLVAISAAAFALLQGPRLAVLALTASAFGVISFALWKLAPTDLVKRVLVRAIEALAKRVGIHSDDLASGYEASLSLLRSPSVGWRSALVLLVFALLNGVVYSLVGEALGLELPISRFLLVTPILLLASVIPLTVQGRGFTEAGALFFWSDGTNDEEIVMACIIVYLFALSQSALASLAWLGRTAPSRETDPRG